MSDPKYAIVVAFLLMAVAATHDAVTTGTISPLLAVALVGLAFLLGALSQSPDALADN